MQLKAIFLTAHSLQTLYRSLQTLHRENAISFDIPARSLHQHLKGQFSRCRSATVANSPLLAAGIRVRQGAHE